MRRPQIIAFYLPQYHPTPHNNIWWGKGFTEWTNVGKAKPLFPGHYQPKIPADLGYYDLRLPEVREAQAELAKEAGIHGFCYYHYWFGDGKEELELPFNEVLRLGKPEFPFMLCWANESWHKKFWNKDGKGSSKEMLIEQIYPGEKDIINHFYRLLPAFTDSRYIKENGKPLFMIYNPLEYQHRKDLIEIWQKLAKENGLPGLIFMCQLRKDISLEICNKLRQEGFEYINTVRLYDLFAYKNSFIQKIFDHLKNIIFKRPYIRDFKKNYKSLFSEIDYNEHVIPTLIPNWDHTPRSGYNGTVLKNSDPILFNEQLKFALKEYGNKPYLFLKSWNEWGEGNYIEPDLRYGKAYIETLAEVLNQI